MKTALILIAFCQTAPTTSPIIKLETKTSFSSGVVIARMEPPALDYYLVLTCAHGKHKSERINATFCDRVRIEGLVYAVDDKRDLALVAVPAEKFKRCHPVQIAHKGTEIKPGDTARVQGYGTRSKSDRLKHRNPYQERSTTIVGREVVNFDGHEQLVMRTKAESKPGDSGGALMVDGKLVGICKGQTLNSKDVDGFFVTHEDILAFIAEMGR